MNLHFGLPHAGGVGKDDIQLLYVTSEVWAQFYSSVNDLGGANFVNGALGFTPSYPDIYVYNGPLYQSPNPNSVGVSLSPSSPQSRPFLGPIDPNNRDGNDNGVSIEKLQYQKNFNERSYLRLFGYGEYSNWFINGPTSANTAYGGEILDYEVHGNTFGATAVYSNQLDNKNLLTMTGSYQTQKLETYSNGFNAARSTRTSSTRRATATALRPAATRAASRRSTTPTVRSTRRGGLNLYSQYGTTVPVSRHVADAADHGAGRQSAIANGAQWLVTENGQNAQIDQVTPFFSAASIADQWRPNEKTTINVGVRFENFLYRLDNTTDSPARAFWFNAYNREYCFPSGATATVQAGVDPNTGASLCAPGTNAQLSNISPNTTSASALEPRIGATYSVDPYTVLRASYGRYAAPVPTSYQQYDTVQQNSASFIGQFVPVRLQLALPPVVTLVFE